MIRNIQRQDTDPYFNIAAEEYFLLSASEDLFMIWRNKPSVIIGKHQNALKEINPGFARRNNIPVIRRISGGGAVYHDEGNINFTFIFTNRNENLIDFREFTAPVIGFLKNSGLDAKFEGKSNITVNGLKVSGNSAHLRKNKVLYHGTLLYNTNLDNLTQAISGQENLFQDKAVGSVRAKVANISELLDNPASIEDFIDLFRDYIAKYFKGITEETLTEEERIAIRKQADEKYKSFEWNFGYSPDYEFQNSWVYNNARYHIALKVKEGIIKAAELSGPWQDNESVAGLLTGCRHDRIAIREKFLKNDPDESKYREELNHLIEFLF